jgi:NAD+ synthase (glutamine-hydrolysing)
VAIEPAFEGFLAALGRCLPAPAGPDRGKPAIALPRCVADGAVNKFGGLLLTTGNKSEYAVGYATIYGDMCGGYAPLKDLYKTEVFALSVAQHRRRHR